MLSTPVLDSGQHFRGRTLRLETVLTIGACDDVQRVGAHVVDGVESHLKGGNGSDERADTLERSEYRLTIGLSARAPCKAPE